MDLTGNHIRAARALLGMDQETLAEKAGISVGTVKNMEATGLGPVGGFASRRDSVRAALERAGIEFTNGDSPGVRLVKGKAKRR